MSDSRISRRGLLKYGAAAAAIVVVGWPEKRHRVPGLSESPDENGLLLPAGCRSRVIARAGHAVEHSDYVWHAAPDGGGVLGLEDGGWIYLSNSERGKGKGGVGAIRFDAAGNITTAYGVHSGGSRNCGGCVTPWRTWLSCEEVSRGITWECDPWGRRPARPREALGVFKHESVAIDPRHNVLYLTEDERDGRFYRFLPARRAGGGVDLSRGVLQVARVADDGAVAWDTVTDPLARKRPTRLQVAGSTPFNGGEGIAYRAGQIFFDTKGDDRVWRYDIDAARLSVFYDAARFAAPPLTGVDTIAVLGEYLLVCEDGGDMQIVALAADGTPRPLLQLLGHDESEITGAALSPDGRRLYFSSQRGSSGKSGDAVTYEVSGRLLG